MKCKIEQKIQITVSSAFFMAVYLLKHSGTNIAWIHRMKSVVTIIYADFIPSEGMSNVMKIHVIFLINFTTVSLGIYKDLFNIDLPFITSFIVGLLPISN